jgi:hypothetical protein
MAVIACAKMGKIVQKNNVEKEKLWFLAIKH